MKAWENGKLEPFGGTQKFDIFMFSKKCGTCEKFGRKLRAPHTSPHTAISVGKNGTSEKIAGIRKFEMFIKLGHPNMHLLGANMGWTRTDTRELRSFLFDFQPLLHLGQR